MAQHSLEQRVTVLESQVAQILERGPRPSARAHWLERVIATFEDEPEFDNVIALGKELRHADNLDEQPE